MKRKRVARKPDRDRYDRFVAEYLKELNATRAAIAAGYSKKTARQQGARLLTVVYVSTAIREAMAKRAERTGISQDRVLYELEHLAFSNIKHYVIDDKDELQLAEGAPEHAMAAVASFRRKPGEFGTEVEIKLWDKPGTLKLAGRHVGLFPDRLEITGKDGGPVLTKKELSTLSPEELRAALLAAAESVPG